MHLGFGWWEAEFLLTRNSNPSFRGFPQRYFYPPTRQQLTKPHTYLALSANCLSFGHTKRFFVSPVPKSTISRNNYDKRTDPSTVVCILKMPVDSFRSLLRLKCVATFLLRHDRSILYQERDLVNKPKFIYFYQLQFDVQLYEITKQYLWSFGVANDGFGNVL